MAHANHRGRNQWTNMPRCGQTLTTGKNKGSPCDKPAFHKSGSRLLCAKHALMSEALLACFPTSNRGGKP